MAGSLALPGVLSTAWGTTAERGDSRWSQQNLCHRELACCSFRDHLCPQPSTSLRQQRASHSCFLKRDSSGRSSFLQAAARSRRRLQVVAASIIEFKSSELELQGLIGTYGFMDVQSYSPSSPSFGLDSPETSAAGYDLKELSKMASQQMGEGAVQVRLYRGRVSDGPLQGTTVIMKAYGRPTPGTGVNADVMAANELSAHAVIQERMGDVLIDGEPCVAVLLGGFATQTGEQWLVFRNDGVQTAAGYAQLAAVATSQGRAVGEGEVWDRLDPRRPLVRRQVFILKLLRGVMSGLSYMHASGRLHQSLGPASVTLNTMEERDSIYLKPRIRDLAFAVDISDEVMLAGGPTLGELWDRQGQRGVVGGGTSSLAEGLWRRAAAAGARTALARRSFGIADDIYAAGLLLAFMALVPFSEVGSIDGPTIQRLLETTFRLDVDAAREYCAADDRWAEGVAFLDQGDGAGWNLLKAMMNPDYRQRPTADTVLLHPWMLGTYI